MHLPIPCSSTVEIPSFLGLSAKFSSSCSLFLLSLIGFTVLGLALALKFVFVARKSKSRDSVGESKVQKSEKVQVQVQRRTWRSFLSTWDGVNLPVTLIAPPTNTVVGRGIGINGAVLGKQMSQPVRSGPAFEQPCTQRCSIRPDDFFPYSSYPSSTGNIPVERTSIYGKDDYVAACRSPSFFRMNLVG